MLNFRRYLSILLLICLAFLFSCADTDESDSDSSPYEDSINLGKHYLTEGNGLKAGRAFEQALELDAESPEARYGIVLSATMHFANVIDQIVATIDALSFAEGIPDAGKSGTTYTPKPTQGSDNQIHLFLLEKIVPQLDRAEVAYTELIEGPELSFELEDYTLTLLDFELIKLGGTFDKTDLHLFGAVNALSDALIKFLLAHDLAFDYTKIILPSLDDDADTVQTISAIVNLIESILASSLRPDFLALDPAYGVENMQGAGISFGNTFWRLDQMYLSLALETDPQDDHPVHYFDKGQTGTYTMDTDPVLLGSTYSFTPKTVMAITAVVPNLYPIFWEGSVLDTDPDTIDTLSPASLNELLRVLDVLPFSLGPFEINALPEFPKLNVGSFFANPQPDGFRETLFLLIELWHLID